MRGWRLVELLDVAVAAVPVVGACVAGAIKDDEEEDDDDVDGTAGAGNGSDEVDEDERRPLLSWFLSPLLATEDVDGADGSDALELEELDDGIDEGGEEEDEEDVRPRARAFLRLLVPSVMVHAPKRPEGAIRSGIRGKAARGIVTAAMFVLVVEMRRSTMKMLVMILGRVAVNVVVVMTVVDAGDAKVSGKAFI